MNVKKIIYNSLTAACSAVFAYAIADLTWDLVMTKAEIRKTSAQLDLAIKKNVGC